jgi:large conductance mechanosensitive channel
VVDLAVGLIMGAAFGKIITSLVNDILMPPIGLLLGKVNFASLYLVLAGSVPEGTSLEEAKKIAGVVTLNYGVFINTILDFVIVALAIFLLIRQINRLKKPAPAPAPAAPTTKECPFCYSQVNLKAIRCPNCTSQL